MYARNTNVSDDRSRVEIERLLIRYGASRFGYFRDERRCLIQFTHKKINIQFQVSLPDENDPTFFETPTGRRRKQSAVISQKLYDREVNRRWRSLALIIKAKLVAIEDGVACFEDEFLPYMVMHDGKTVAEKLLPLVQDAQQSGKLLTWKKE